MDETERYSVGTYSSEQEAIEKAKEIVDTCLLGYFKAGITADDLHELYVQFGDDPFIRGSEFSAWDYAREKANQMVEENANNLDWFKNPWFADSN